MKVVVEMFGFNQIVQFWHFWCKIHTNCICHVISIIWAGHILLMTYILMSLTELIQMMSQAILLGYDLDYTNRLKALAL